MFAAEVRISKKLKEACALSSHTIQAVKRNRPYPAGKICDVGSLEYGAGYANTSFFPCRFQHRHGQQKHPEMTLHGISF